MLILLSSGVIWNSAKQQFYPGILESLKAAKQGGHSFFLVSNKPKPTWLDSIDFIKFVSSQSRQSGKIIKRILDANEGILLPRDIVIWGCTDEDFMMAANSSTLLIRCEWAPLGEKIKNYGVPWGNPTTLVALIDFLESRQPWYFISQDSFLDIYSLTDAGYKFESNLEVKRLTQHLQYCLKDGHKNLKNGFILHCLSSVYSTPDFAEADIWAYYPSSSSSNSGQEIMAEFAGLARKIYKKQLSQPLLLRHTASPKRHIVGGDRNDPASQLKTVQLNPFYQGKLRGKTIVVFDDYLNRGVSFGVSAALLKTAGAKKVIGVSMGKFGNSALRYDIQIGSDPFAPLTKWKESRIQMTGVTTTDAKLAFLKKFKK